MDTENDLVQVSCVIFRDFITDWSEIPIEIGGIVDWKAGYRVYQSDKATSPVAKGYTNYMQLQIKYLRAHMFTVMMTVLAAAATAIMV